MLLLPLLLLLFLLLLLLLLLLLPMPVFLLLLFLVLNMYLSCLIANLSEFHSVFHLAVCICIILEISSLMSKNYPGSPVTGPSVKLWLSVFLLTCCNYFLSLLVGTILFLSSSGLRSHCLLILNRYVHIRKAYWSCG